MPKSFALLAALPLIFGLTACASGRGGSSKIQTRVGTEPSLNFSKYRTFALAVPPSSKQSLEPEMRASINNALNTGLAARGITPSKTPEFYIVYHFTSAEQSSPRSYTQWAPESAGSTATRSYTLGSNLGSDAAYPAGTLIIDFVDTNSHRAFFRGTSVGEAGPLPRTDAVLTRAVGQILQSVPVL